MPSCTATQTSDKPRTPRQGCEFCSGDDKQMLVSVSPRRLGLPRTNDEKTNMEIRNGNAFPIYYKTNTSNANFLSAQPKYGCIPPNSKASVVVSFFNSAVPCRKHEEVIVLTSAKPFHQGGTHEEEVYKRQNTINAQRDRRQFQDGVNFSDSNSDGTNDKPQVHQCNTNYHRRRDCSQTLDDEKDHRDDRRSDKKDHLQDYQFHSYEIPSLKTRDATKRTGGGSPEFEEICLHALVHRITHDKSCTCNNCVDLCSLQLSKARADKTDRVADPEPQTETRRFQTTKPLGRYTTHQDTKGRKEFMDSSNKEAKSEPRAKEPHVVARVATCVNTSDTDMSELCKWGGMQRRRHKLISEERFAKRLEKAKRKKLRKMREEASQSTTSTEVSPRQKDSAKTAEKKAPVSVRIRRKWTLFSLEEKSSRLLRLSWVNLVLALVLLLSVFGFELTKRSTGCDSTCFYQLLK